MRRALFAAVLLTLLAKFGVAQALPDSAPTVMATLNIGVRELNLRSMDALVNIDVQVSIPPDARLTLVPVHAPQNPQLRVYLRPTTHTINVLSGPLRPDNNFYVVAVLGGKDTANIAFAIENVRLPLDQIGQDSSQVALPFRLDRAFEQAQASFAGIPVAKINRVRVTGDLFVASEPEATVSSVTHQPEIQLNKNGTNQQAALITLRVQDRGYTLYLFLGILGLLIGLLTAPRVINSKRGAWITLVGCIIILFGGYYVFFAQLSAKEQLDLTVIVTFGTLNGILIGIGIAAIQKLRTRSAA